jgi:hypothetical protein
MLRPSFARIAARGALALAGLAVAATVALAVPLSPEELAKVCAQAEDTAHCGRLVEQVQLKRLPNLATRDGATLRVSLFPSGTQPFVDTEALNGGRSYSLWDFVSEINAVVLYTTDGDDATFTLLQRTNGRQFELPSDPKVSPDRARLVTADFCATRCTNELAVWRVTREGIRKESAWKPKEAWQDAAASWADADTLVIEYTAKGATSPAKLQRKLADPSWTRVSAP